MESIRDITTQLELRRQDLGMTCASLARRTGLGLRTVQRVLSGAESDAQFSTVAKLANALGMIMRFESVDLNEVRRRAAEMKAAQLVDMVQGTMALEAQAVGNEAVLRMRERTVRDLLAGSNQKLWDP